MLKKIMQCLLIGCFLFLQIPDVQAKANSYTIEEVHKDGTTTILDERDTYEQALVVYKEQEKKVNNLLIRGEDYIWKVKYGIVLFDMSQACDVNVSYKTKDESGYTNGCYGIDAAYLDTSDDQNEISFLLSGASATGSTQNMNIMPIEAAIKISQYYVADGKLYHQIKTQMKNDSFSSSIYLGEAPKSLQDEHAYYSYDGHYFYPVQDDDQGYYVMIDDLKKNTHANAVNPNEPYYNYYQYLSHRSTSSYDEEDVNSYIEDTLRINKPLTSYISMNTSYHAILSQSMLKGQGNAFVQYQNEFGANALMMMSLAMNESATGRSYLAFTRNNLFGHAAYDSAVEENASRYQSIASSIYSHAKHYINDSYLNPVQFQYHGGFFGNKASGMNVSYASDPYWGEKAAQYYYRIDDKLDQKDYNQYSFAIAKDDPSVKIYKDKDIEGDILYETNGMRDFAMIILGEDQTWYKIQSDPNLGSGEIFDYEKSVAYVQKKDIAYIFNKDKISEKNYKTITFDAVDGVFQNGTSKIALQYEEGAHPAIVAPIKEGSYFTGWDKDIKKVSDDISYQATYEQVQTTRLTTLPKQAYTKDEQLNVSNGVLQVTLASGKQIDIPLDSSMVSGYDPTNIGSQTLVVYYQGLHTSYDVTVNAANTSIQNDLVTRIQTLLESIDEFSPLSSEQRDELISLKQAMMENGSPLIDPYVYRKLDRVIQKAYGNSLQVILNEDGLDASVSGLAIAAPLDEPSFLPTILKMKIQEDVGGDAQQALENVAIGNGYTPDFTFSMEGSLGFGGLKLQDDLQVSIKKPTSDQANHDYLVLQYHDGDVQIIPSSQSENYISFTTNSLGDYAIISRPSSNVNGNEDLIENNTVDNNGTDYIQIIKWALFALAIVLIILITLLTLRKRNKKNRRKAKPKGTSVNQNKQKDEPSFLANHNLKADKEEDHHEQ